VNYPERPVTYRGVWQQCHNTAVYCDIENMNPVWIYLFREPMTSLLGSPANRIGVEYGFGPRSPTGEDSELIRPQLLRHVRTSVDVRFDRCHNKGRAGPVVWGRRGGFPEDGPRDTRPFRFLWGERGWIETPHPPSTRRHGHGGRHLSLWSGARMTEVRTLQGRSATRIAFSTLVIEIQAQVRCPSRAVHGHTRCSK